MVPRKQVRQFLVDNGLRRIADQIAQRLVQSLFMETTAVESDADIPVGASRIGGSPDLPAATSWPRFKADNQRFIAQVNLRDAYEYWRAVPESPAWPLPADGLLSFFWAEMADEWSGTISSPASSHVCLTPAASGRLARVTDPWSLVPAKRTLTQRLLGTGKSSHGRGYVPCSVRFVPSWTLRETGAQPAVAFDDDERELWYNDLLDQLEGLGFRMYGHRLLGGATPIQDSVEVDAELLVAPTRSDGAPSDWKDAAARADRWRLLLQMDADEKPNFLFGDLGSLYFMLPETALTANDWRHVVAVPQCH